ncbi:hypothetical protein [Vibrio methylphosphonaticus]|uniref:hypothetical protein n=1 Tax=Vibrio methylphosphonaticus TaxID=2946866 RepID=UPI00202A1B3D|nr:hypothetical protein [Vibrio methylphosphonaticus]MCL9776256.1 hypothetical protein [Vibrio methylphosphonaticus]
MKVQLVKPDNGSQEGKFLLVGVVVLFLFGFFALPFNQVHTERSELASHQVGSNEVSSKMLNLLAQLQLAHQEIHDIQLDYNNEDDKNSNEDDKNATAQKWPSITELETLYLAPFIKDKNWENLGQLTWTDSQNGVYSAVAQQDFDVKKILLDLRNDDAEVWINATNTPLESYSTPSLIGNDWKQIVFVKIDRQSH